MILDQPSQILAMLRNGKMINIGGRPVIVPNPKPGSSRDKSDAIKLALAFVAIYVIWGLTYLAIRYAVGHHFEVVQYGMGPANCPRYGAECGPHSAVECGLRAAGRYMTQFKFLSRNAFKRQLFRPASFFNDLL